MSWRRKIVWDGYRRIVLNSSKIHSGVKFSTRIMTALHLMNIWYLLRAIPFSLSQIQSFLRSFSTLGVRVCLSVCVHADAIFIKFVICDSQNEFERCLWDWLP